MLIRFSLLLMVVLGMMACNSGERYRDIRNYYFPLRALEDGLVYEYRPVHNDSFPPEYWYYRSLFPGDSLYLSATFYAPNLIPKQQMTQKMTNSGITLKDMYLYEPDSNRKDVQHQIPVKVVADDVFPFKVRPEGGLYLYHIQWKPPQDPEATIRLIKNRRYLGDSTVLFGNKRLTVARFSVRELLEYDANGIFEQEYDGEEWYAKGIGLIYYCKNISEDFKLAYQLEDRYPMEQLETAFRSMYGIEKQKTIIR